MQCTRTACIQLQRNPCWTSMYQSLPRPVRCTATASAPPPARAPPEPCTCPDHIAAPAPLLSAQPDTLSGRPTPRQQHAAAAACAARTGTPHLSTAPASGLQVASTSASYSSLIARCHQRPHGSTSHSSSLRKGRREAAALSQVPNQIIAALTSDQHGRHGILGQRRRRRRSSSSSSSSSMQAHLFHGTISMNSPLGRWTPISPTSSSTPCTPTSRARRAPTAVTLRPGCLHGTHSINNAVHQQCNQYNTRALRDAPTGQRLVPAVIRGSEADQLGAGKAGTSGEAFD